MRLEDLSTQLLYTAIPIIRDGHLVSTGFIVSIKVDENKSILLMVSHVSNFSGDDTKILLHGSEDGKPSKKNIEITITEKAVIDFRLEGTPLIAVPLAATLNGLAQKKIVSYLKSVDNTLALNEDIMNQMPSYETLMVLSYDAEYFDNSDMIPLFKHAVTASPVNYKYRGKRQFLIEMLGKGCYNGCPVFIFDNGTYLQGETLQVGMRVIWAGVIIESNENKNISTVMNSMLIESKIREKYL